METPGLRHKAARAALITCLLLCACSVLRAEDFSADMVNSAQGRTFTGKIFMAGDKIRIETPEAITITRLDTKTIWVLMPQQRLYLEQAFSAPAALLASARIAGETGRTLVGEETVQGRSARKYRVTFSQAGRTESVFQWFWQGLNIPVKTAAADSSWSVEYRNIRVTPQSPALFEIPQGYKKFSPGASSLAGLVGTSGQE